MPIQKSIFKTLFTLVAIAIVSMIGFPSVARGYGSIDKQILGASIGPTPPGGLPQTGATAIWSVVGIISLILVSLVYFMVLKKKSVRS